MRLLRPAAPARSTRQNAAVVTRANTGLCGVWGLGGRVCTAAVTADTLVLRDGNRVDGTVLAMRDGVIEFEARRGFLGRERMRIDRAKKKREELDKRAIT